MFTNQLLTPNEILEIQSFTIIHLWVFKVKNQMSHLFNRKDILRKAIKQAQHKQIQGFFSQDTNQDLHITDREIQSNQSSLEWVEQQLLALNKNLNLLLQQQYRIETPVIEDPEELKRIDDFIARERYIPIQDEAIPAVTLSVPSPKVKNEHHFFATDEKSEPAPLEITAVPNNCKNVINTLQTVFEMLACQPMRFEYLASLLKAITEFYETSEFAALDTILKQIQQFGDALSMDATLYHNDTHISPGRTQGFLTLMEKHHLELLKLNARNFQNTAHQLLAHLLKALPEELYFSRLTLKLAILQFDYQQTGEKQFNNLSRNERTTLSVHIDEALDNLDYKLTSTQASIQNTLQRYTLGIMTLIDANDLYFKSGNQLKQKGNIEILSDKLAYIADQFRQLAENIPDEKLHSTQKLSHLQSALVFYKQSALVAELNWPQHDYTMYLGVLNTYKKMQALQPTKASDYVRLSQEFMDRHDVPFKFRVYANADLREQFAAFQQQNPAKRTMVAAFRSHTKC